MIDLDALFAAPSPDEIAAVWDSFPTQFSADRFRLVGDPVERDGVTGQLLEYYGHGLRLYGALFRPTDVSSGPLPLLMSNHSGGNWREPFDPESHPFTRWCWELPRAGYVVLGAGYRGELMGALGRSEGAMEVFKGEVSDVLNLLECGKSLPYVDSTRIGMWGFSHGASITASASQRSSDVRAGACLGTPGDACFAGFGASARSWIEDMVSGKSPEDVLQRTSGAQLGLLHAVFWPLVQGSATVQQTRYEMIARTPRLFADHTLCPLLIACGDGDPGYQHSIALDAALGAAGKEHEFHAFRGVGHSISGEKVAPGARTPWDVTIEFLNRHL